MKALKNTALLVTMILLLTGLTTAIGTQPQQAIQAESPNIQTTDGEIKDGLLDSFDLSFLLSSLSGPDQVNPGDDITFDVSAEATQTFNIENKVKVVEIYKCQDSTCDHGEFVEATSSTIAFDAELSSGTEFAWVTTYTTPTSPEGYYVATGYISDGNGNVLTDSPEHKFIVGSVDDTSSSSPDMRLSRSPSFNINEEANTVVGSLGIKNVGDGDMTQNDIVEMQVRPSGSGPLSFTSAQQVCDQDYPNNVHKEYRVDSGDSKSVTLSAGSGLEDGQSYTVYFLTRDGCYPDNEKVDPIYNSYNAGTFTFSDEVSDPSEPQDVVQVSKPELSYEDGTISTTVSFKNKGGDMPDNDIVEMQVRPSGEGPLSFSSTQEVCDNSHPENVHKEYNLSSGESDSTTLSTSAFDQEGSYTVYLLTREGCYPDNEKVDPYYNSVRAGTVEFDDEGDGWVSVVEENALPIALIGLGVLLVGLWFVFLRD